MTELIALLMTLQFPCVSPSVQTGELAPPLPYGVFLVARPDHACEPTPEAPGWIAELNAEPPAVSTNFEESAKPDPWERDDLIRGYLREIDNLAKPSPFEGEK